jgi:hypothetical protein
MDTIKTSESVQDIEHGILGGEEDIYGGDYFLFCCFCFVVFVLLFLFCCFCFVVFLIFDSLI